MKNDELKILIPAVELETSQGTITINPFKFKDFPKALGLVSKYLDTFMGAESAFAIANSILSDSGEETLADISSLVALTSGKDREWLDNLTWDEVFEILLAIVEQNIDFFYRMGQRVGQTVKKRQPESKTVGESTSAA